MRRKKGYDVGFVRGRGQIGFDNGDFAGFFVGQIGAAAARKLFDRFFALLHQSLQNLKRLGVVERADLFDFLIFQGAFHHAQDA